MSSALHLTFQIAAAFGILLAIIILLGLLRRRQQEIRIQGRHPIIGDFEYSPYFETWHALSLLPTGNVVKLHGWGRSPSDTQSTLWQQCIARYDALSALTQRTLLLTLPPPLQKCTSVTLTPAGMTFAKDGRLNMGFRFTTTPDISWTSECEEPFPIAIFSPTLELEKAEWIRPYD